jgi:NADPH2:quinone reductase
MKAVRVHAVGGPEALVFEDVPDPRPEAGQVLVKVEAVGVNFAEIYARKGVTPAPLPIAIGAEAAGTVAEIAPDVTDFKAGDKVAFYGVPGSYAEQVCVPAGRLVRVPEDLGTKLAAAVLLQGMTAHYLVEDTWPLQPGQTCLVHAAAGGVGLLLCQLARERGARVIGTVSTAEKEKAAREAGADEVIRYTEVDFDEETKKLTNGRGVDVIYDSVGQTTFMKGLNCLRPRGMMVVYGQSSGLIDPVDIGLLNRGSFFLTRPTLVHHSSAPELASRSQFLFERIADGRLKVRIHSEYPLSQAAAAQNALEQRETIGKVLLIP